ncbi:MAG: response regulator transcription factor [Ruminococcus sp.]|jgi:DNA-binding response OmpR family regulator
MQRIIVVEDDREMNQNITYVLEKEGYEVTPACSIAEAKGVWKAEDISLVLLDVNLPDGEGFEFCRWVRARSSIPVLFLTARDLEEDALKGYEMGAEDYVTKPFSMKILLKKISVILKRSQEEQGSGFDDGFLKIDLTEARVQVKGKTCSVTPTEFRILKEFLAHKGQLLTYSVLLDRMWDGGNQFVDRHALAVNMNRLRGKIENADHKYISNVYGMGYQWIGK